MFKILASGVESCDLTGKEGEGVYVEDEKSGRAFLSWKALRQQVEYETKKQKVMAPVLEAVREPS